MSWRFFGWGEATSVRELVARHEYDKAIGVLRATLKKQPGDRRLRLDLADVLVHAGEKPQAIKVLLDLADELFRGDFRARARVVLKRVDELDPGRPDVAERLERMARREGMSLSAFATRELATLSRRADNAALLAALPDLGVDASSVVADIEAGRAER